MKMLLWMPGVVLTLATMVQAAQMPPAPEPTLLPSPDGDVVWSESYPIELYQNVRYKDLKNIHPCAVEKIIAIPHPCPDPCQCGPQCVYIRVCVPPCDCYSTKVKRFGRKIVMDFGKYKVNITTRLRGEVVVDYDD